MSETGKPNGDLGPPGQPVHVQILGQYVKDLSFENPGAPWINPAIRPQHIDLGVDLQVRKLEQDRFEVDLKLRASAQAEQKPVFLLELVYGALVLIQNAPEEFAQQILLIDVPHLLFPFARRIIADAVADGGMPPVMLDPIDFAALYRAKATQGQLRTGPTAVA
jgi:preprotein translocase subunit SecB